MLGDFRDSRIQALVEGYVIEADELDRRTVLSEDDWKNFSGIRQFVSARRLRGYKRDGFALAWQRNLNNSSATWTAGNLKCRSNLCGSLAHPKDSKVV